LVDSVENSMAGNYFHDPRPFYGLNQHNLISMDEVCIENHSLDWSCPIVVRCLQGFVRLSVVYKPSECGLFYAKFQ